MGRPSTVALTRPAVIDLDDNGWKMALDDDIQFRTGLNVQCGRITCIG